MTAKTPANSELTRAPKGGTTGKNGERYAGGTFLPSTTAAKKAPAARKLPTGKCEVGPYTFAARPFPGARDLYSSFRALVEWNDGKPGALLTEYLDYKNYTAEERAAITAARDAWLSGQRWHSEV